MRLVLLSVSEHDALAVSKETAIRLFSTPVIDLQPGERLKPNDGCYRLRLTPPGAKRFPLHLEGTAHTALFTEHHPDEFALRVLDPQGQPMQPLFARAYNPGHTHDDAVSSVGIVEERPVNIHKLNLWLGELLREQGADIYRMKGVLHLADSINRFVFQGVHMLFDGQADRPWREDEPRQSQMIFIGRNLDRADLTAGFRACLD
jgi:G3E family GTPase